MKQLIKRGSLAAAIGVAVTGCLLLPQAKAFFAYTFDCDYRNALSADPNKHGSVGYITDFEGLGFTAAKDIAVHVPASPTYTPLAVKEGVAHVAAILDHVTWDGGVGDKISFSCYMSQENAHHLKTLGSNVQKSTAIGSLGFWVVNYHQERKQWFEQFHPLAPAKLAGQLAGSGKSLAFHVGDESVKVMPNSEARVYNVYFEVIPAPNQTAVLSVASAPNTKVTKPWGFKAGH